MRRSLLHLLTTITLLLGVGIATSGQIPMGGGGLAAGAVGTAQYVLKSSTQTNATTTFASDADLVFALPASQTWVIRWTLIVSGTDNNGDMKACPNVPSGATGHWAANGMQDVTATGASGTVALFSLNTLTDGCGLQIGAVNGLDVIQNYELYVTTSTTAGNAVLRWALQNASGTLSVKAGSYLTALRLL